MKARIPGGARMCTRMHGRQGAVPGQAVGMGTKCRVIKGGVLL